MANFIPRAKKLQERKVFGATSGEIQAVLDAAYKDLRIVQTKSRIQYYNIEELFSAIDMGAMLGVFGSRDPSTLEDLQKAVRVFIYRTLEETILLPQSDGKIGLPKGYSGLAAATRDTLRKRSPSLSAGVSFITFNYDTSLEYALTRSGIGVDYALQEPLLEQEGTRYENAVPVLKLHGSINWSQCERCNVIVPIEIDPWRNASVIDIVDQGTEVKLAVGSRIAGRNHHCGSALQSVPFLVPPTWNKSTGAHGLKQVWRRAAQELAEADHVVVIGYSLPPSDAFFRYLFALGANSDVSLEKFIVINGEQGAESEPRFRSLLGPTSENAFRSYSFVFSGVEHIIRQILED